MKPLRIAVCSGFTADAITAHALNVVKMAEGFGALGHEVLLLCREDRARNTSPHNMLARYGVNGNTFVHLLPWASGNHWEFSREAMCQLLTFEPDLVYARSYILPWATSQAGLPTVAESHAHVGSTDPRFLQFMTAGGHGQLRSLVTISPVLKEYYASCGFPEEKIRILADGVDLDRFTPPDAHHSRLLRGSGPKLVYAGHLHDYKGIPTVLEAARLLPAVTIHLVGGHAADVAMQQERARTMGLGNVVFHGHVDHVRVPEYLWEADALLLPPSGKHPSSMWTSPMKLGEYMAARRPVILSDIPALRHWVAEDEAIFFKPDDGASLAAAIKRCLDGGTTDAMVRSAALKAREWSFAERARHILDCSLNH